ncbi:hypothetical protein SAMN05660909_03979 [Chitinophaga terrae (ex Kim and Jung 2007)]|uniref:Uncharacterized protein n=1 Tax=Chitinophaga terrae (ex Kim and Jung 2007) TaxID=408074 RepID=A0A1H4EXG3_9BACT|nr:DUF6766 family protein [Chitinophaga terrae (ex Kim and Jung 2007)]GEP90670.1 hypothetical protein CTE07_23150 [Chitinophaga terrae (ex Kim and Jung 2007)]SEA89310.1 hypothetical protein SAMN05660909_03979 [Chitinophaga terrae (ex Kim and Jung 2007)]
MKTKPSYLKRKAYFYVTLLLFMISVFLHWFFGWKDYKQEQLTHSQPPQVEEYAVQMMRETMENWQSEFLQLIWQVVGLSFLWYCGSPQSKEGDDRREEKLDFIIKRLEPDNADELLAEWKRKYPEK